MRKDLKTISGNGFFSGISALMILQIVPDMSLLNSAGISITIATLVATGTAVALRFSK